jgi:hypothetical protein
MTLPFMTLPFMTLPFMTLPFMTLPFKTCESPRRMSNLEISDQNAALGPKRRMWNVWRRACQAEH